MGVLIVGSRGLDLRPGEIRSFVAQESEEAEVEGWVEAKRTADQMEDTITMGPGAQDTMRKRQARDVTYPRAGGSAAGSVERRVSFSEDNDEVIIQELPATAEQSESEEEEEEETPLPGKKTARRGSRKSGTQRARRVPIKLRAEAQPEKMVDKILDQPID